MIWAGVALQILGRDLHSKQPIRAEDFGQLAIKPITPVAAAEVLPRGSMSANA